MHLSNRKLSSLDNGNCDQGLLALQVQENQVSQSSLAGALPGARSQTRVRMFIFTRGSLARRRLCRSQHTSSPWAHGVSEPRTHSGSRYFARGFLVQQERKRSHGTTLSNREPGEINPSGISPKRLTTQGNPRQTPLKHKQARWQPCYEHSPAVRVS